VAKKKTNEQLDAEILALFEDAEEEVTEGEEAKATAKEQAKEAAAPTKSKLEKVAPGKNVLGTETATTVPTGKASKVSPALQRFAFNSKDKK